MDFWAAATSRARDLASLDLDAMAADDDYIHTASLNVAKPTGTVELTPHTPSSVATGIGAALSSAVAPFTTSQLSTSQLSSSSTLAKTTPTNAWSLLDRRPPPTSRPSAKSGAQLAEEATARLNALVFNDDAPTVPVSAPSSASSSCYVRGATPSSSAHSRAPAPVGVPTREAWQTQSYATEGHDDDDYDDDDDDLYDEDDPILSLLRSSTPNQTKPPLYETSRSTTSQPSTPSSRFLSDLEQRTAQTTPSSSPEEAPVSSRKLWPWQARPTDGPATAESSSRLSLGPLWGRPKKKKPLPEDDPTENFTTVSSGNLALGEEERQALANLQQRSTSGSGTWCDRETFVLATFLLGAAVYFYSRMSAADDAGL